MAGQSSPAPRLYQQVAEKLIRLIDSGKYEAGKRLPAERVLANLYEVSRPTIREAIIALEIERYVEVRTGSGVYILENRGKEKSIADKDVGPFELTETRALFEGETAALAADLITDEELVTLKNILNRMEGEEDTKANEALDKEFHMTIANATRNETIAGVIENLWDLREQSELTRQMYERVRNQGVKPSVEEHRDIYKALAARDARGARKAMRNHLTRVIDGILEATEIEVVEAAKNEINKSRARYSLSKKLA